MNDTHAEPIVGTSLTTDVEFNETALALSDLRDRYKGLVVDVQTPKGLKEAKTFTFELRTLRTTLEKKRKDLKAPILARVKQLDDEAKRITAEIVALEEPIDVQIKAEEARIENARLAKLEAERVRVESLKAKIQTIRDTPSQMVGKPSSIINGALVRLSETALDEAEFAEYYQEASDALMAAMARVEQLLHAQKEHEAEQARIKADREELERVRAENERMQREADERAVAESFERERLARVERDNQQRHLQAVRDRMIDIIGKSTAIGSMSSEDMIQRRVELESMSPQNDVAFFGEFFDEAMKGWRASLEDLSNAIDAKVAREAQEASDRARREQEEATLQAERERQTIEQERIREAQAQLKRDQDAAAKKAEAVRLANVTLAGAAYDALTWATQKGFADEQVFIDLKAAIYNDEAAPTKPARAKRAK